MCPFVLNSTPPSFEFECSSLFFYSLYSFLFLYIVLQKPHCLPLVIITAGQFRVFFFSFFFLLGENFDFLERKCDREKMYKRDIITRDDTGKEGVGMGRKKKVIIGGEKVCTDVCGAE